MKLYQIDKMIYFLLFIFLFTNFYKYVIDINLLYSILSSIKMDFLIKDNKIYFNNNIDKYDTNYLHLIVF